MSKPIKVSKVMKTRTIPPAPPGTANIDSGTRIVSQGRPPNQSSNSLVECKFCKRKFDADRLKVHQPVCVKQARKTKRNIFDSAKHRLSGTDAADFQPNLNKNSKIYKPPVNNWRRTHTELVEALRSARKMHRFVASGGNPADLPPPPPSDYSHYIQCPSCGRRFNETAAGRHIPQCKNYVYNKK